MNLTESANCSSEEQLGHADKKGARIEGLDLLKAFAMLFVVTLHVPLWSYDFSGGVSMGSVLEYAGRLLAEGVPVFVMVNGFLLFGKQKFNFKVHLKKTLHLFIVFLIWAFIQTLINGYLIGDTMSAGKLVYLVLQTQIGKGYDGVLWFMENFIALYLIYPLIRLAYDHDRKLFMYIFWLFAFFSVGISTLSLIRDAIAVYHNTNLLNDGIDFLNRFNPTGNAYFVFCLMLGGILHDSQEWLVKHKLELAVTGLAAWAAISTTGIWLSVKTGQNYSSGCNYCSISMVIMMISMTALSLSFRTHHKFTNRLLSCIGKNTMGIYLIHYIMIFAWNRFIGANGNFVHRFLEVIIIYFISLLITVILRKIPVLKKAF